MGKHVRILSTIHCLKTYSYITKIREIHGTNLRLKVMVSAIRRVRECYPKGIKCVGHKNEPSQYFIILCTFLYVFQVA